MVNTVDTTIVVLVPESGGNLQTMKAGLMEIADLLVINKADPEGAFYIKEEVQKALNLKRRDNGWEVMVLPTQANEGKGGVAELFAKIEYHRDFIIQNKLFIKEKWDFIDLIRNSGDYQ